MMGSISPLNLPYLATDLIVVTRSGIIENCHSVHAAVVDFRGSLLYSVGNPHRVTLTRSAAKPAQALAVLESPTLDVNEVELALMCASHNADVQHIAIARSILAKCNAKEDDLACGGHASISEAVNRLWIYDKFTPTAIYNNCSGKHAGMLAAAGQEKAGYHLPSHPVQVRVKRMVEDLCGTTEVQWAVDGCNLPTPAAPLHNLANMYAFFASASASATSSTTKREQAAARIFNAMNKHPDLVAGQDRFCTDLMLAFPGLLIGKVGAEGFYGIGIRSSLSDQMARLRGVGAVGIAVKIEDGNLTVLYSAVVGLLEKLGLGIPVSLEKWRARDVVNTAGVVTGHFEHRFELRAADV